VEGEKASRNLVAAKFGFVDDAQEMMLTEMAILRHLRKAGVRGIPEPLGFFHDGDDDGPCCLMMSFEGKALSGLKGRPLTSQQR
jgi:hypothetical protein